MLNKLSTIEKAIERLDAKRTVKEWYTPREVARILGKAEFTVREWCRNKRIRAIKRPSMRASGVWAIPHTELLRIQNEGLLPIAEPDLV
jgi:hypothetical protein